jgi:hypothetical protein
VYHIVTRKKPDAEPVADDDKDEKKERVLHTRVPERLDAHLRQRAEDLGISVSNLVRNVLGHAFGLVGDVVADSHAIARAARGDSRPGGPVGTSGGGSSGSPPSIDDVIAWQPVVLGKNAVCAKCNAIVAKGMQGAIGAGTTIVICTRCLEGLA